VAARRRDHLGVGDLHNRKEKIYKNYAPGPQDLTNVNLGTAYYNQMRPIVDEQLEKAGVRLAKILEAIFGI
jgi:hypothetical protein